MSTEIQKAMPSQLPQTVEKMFEENRMQIQQVLPTHVDITRFIKSALLAIARNPSLKKCTPTSLLTSVINAAELGLDFTPAKGHAYLVPYGTDATFMPGYRGLAELAIRGGKVSQIWSYLVYENDEFTLVYGTIPDIKHVPKITGDRGKIIGAYAVAKFHDGSVQFEYMDYAQLMAIKKRSRAANNGPWVTDEGEMLRKTTMRRLYKYIPSSPDLEKAIELDNAAVGFVTDMEIDGAHGISRTAKLANMIGEEPDPNRIDVEQCEAKQTSDSDIINYGPYVRMSKTDYDSLVLKYDTPTVDKSIDEFNEYIEKHPDKAGGNHSERILRNLKKNDAVKPDQSTLFGK